MKGKDLFWLFVMQLWSFQSVRDAAMVISECEDETVYNDRLEDLKKEIESSLTDYRGNMEALNIAGLSRQQLLSHPCATTRFNIEIP
jgi:hypothetical protein